MIALNLNENRGLRCSTYCQLRTAWGGWLVENGFFCLEMLRETFQLVDRLINYKVTGILLSKLDGNRCTRAISYK